MTDSTQKKTRKRVDPADRISRLREQQATLQAQIKAEERKLREREEAKSNERRIAVGKLAELAGVLFAADDVLLAALRSISTKTTGDVPPVQNAPNE